MRKLSLVVLIILVLVVARLSFFTVGPTEFVYLTQFGQHLATYDGGAESHSDAGLYVCWPWPIQSVQRLDRRLQYFDLPATELPTRDADRPEADLPSMAASTVGLLASPLGQGPFLATSALYPGRMPENRIDKMLFVEAYVCWRIANKENVDLFIRTLGTAERAQEILGQRINSQLGAAISQLSTSDLINMDARLVEGRMSELRAGTLAILQQPLLQKYGVELVDVRLRRFYHSPQVTEAIYEAIRAKRKQKAQEYYSDGEYKKTKIMKDADFNAQKIESDAKAYAKQKTKDAETDALEIRNQAYKKDKELHEFLQKLEALKTTLKQNKTLLLLSTHRTFFEMLFQPPNSNGAAVGAPPGPPAPMPEQSGKDNQPKTPPGGN